MSSIQDFTKWKEINEQKLDIDSKSSKKQNRKANKRSNRKSTYLSDSGVEFALIKRKSDGDSNTDAYILKSKNKDSKIWDAKGVITADVDSFLQDELFGGTTEGKYDEESIELDEYKQGARKDNVKFTVKLADKEAKKKKEADEAKEKAEPTSEPKAEAKTADLYKAITIPENDEGEKRIEIGQESTVLPEIKEILRKSYIKQGLKLPTQTFGVSWLDASKLEDIDSQWIKMLRAGFKMKSADYITQGFVKNMVDQANLWNNAPKAVPAEEVKKEAAAAPTEDVASNESLLFSFSGFIKVNEEFDMAAANAVATESKPEASSKKKSSSSSSGGSGSSGLTDDQASAYRIWANTGKDVDKYGKTSKFDLDAKGSNNSFVKKSYAQAKKDRDNESGIFSGTIGLARRVAFDAMFKDKASSDKAGDTNSSELRKSMQSDFYKANTISSKLTTFWSTSGGSTFKPWKGLDDDEAGALAGGYLPWLKSSGINQLLASIVNPYYKMTMTGVIDKTKEEMTDTVGNTISWEILNPKEIPNTADEGLTALAKHVPSKTDHLGIWFPISSAIIKQISKYVTPKSHMKKFSIPGAKFDF